MIGVQRCNICGREINEGKNLCSQCRHKVRQAKYGMGLILSLLKVGTPYEDQDDLTHVIIAS